ncbi:hypothetical protein C8F01DRAFT_1325712 [Mycena amicta]|nr:hypothetical protein C8F01DRAFT_1325712 [Mycena amicta]
MPTVLPGPQAPSPACSLPPTMLCELARQHPHIDSAVKGMWSCAALCRLAADHLENLSACAGFTGLRVCYADPSFFGVPQAFAAVSKPATIAKCLPEAAPDDWRYSGSVVPHVHTSYPLAIAFLDPQTVPLRRSIPDEKTRIRFELDDGLVSTSYESSAFRPHARDLALPNDRAGGFVDPLVHWSLALIPSPFPTIRPIRETAISWDGGIGRKRWTYMRTSGGTFSSLSLMTLEKRSTVPRRRSVQRRHSSRLIQSLHRASAASQREHLASQGLSGIDDGDEGSCVRFPFGVGELLRHSQEVLSLLTPYTWSGALDWTEHVPVIRLRSPRRRYTGLIPFIGLLTPKRVSSQCGSNGRQATTALAGTTSIPVTYVFGRPGTTTGSLGVYVRPLGFSSTVIVRLIDLASPDGRRVHSTTPRSSPASILSAAGTQTRPPSPSPSTEPTHEVARPNPLSPMELADAPSRRSLSLHPLFPGRLPRARPAFAAAHSPFSGRHYR